MSRPRRTPAPDAGVPHNIDIERALLGHVMLKHAIPPDAANVQPSDFFREGHRDIWAAMRALDARGEPIDLLPVQTELASRQRLEPAGGVAYLTILTDTAYAFTPVGQLVTKAREYADAREFYTTCLRTAQSVSANPFVLRDGIPGHARQMFERVLLREPAAAEAVATAPPELPLAALLDGLVAYVRKYVVMPAPAADLVALWVAHTWTFESADTTAYLNITAAAKESGKTRLLEVLESVVRKPWFVSHTTTAALARKIDAETPTLLLDEADAAFKGPVEYTEHLRAVLCSGYRRQGGKTTVCTGKGADITTADLRTFCPKAITGIGALPDTLASRVIRIELKRRTKAEPVAKLRRRTQAAETRPLVAQLQAWARAAVTVLRHAEPVLPAGLGDRTEDVVEPLLAIADLAREDWPTRARAAALALTGPTAAPDDDIQTALLEDVQTIFSDGATFMASQALAEKLAALPDRPWATWSKGKQITPNRLAQFFKPFGIYPQPGPRGDVRGYYQDRFIDAWARYLAFKPSNRQTPNDSGPEPAISECQTPPPFDGLKTAIRPMITGTLDGLTLPKPDMRPLLDTIGETDDDGDRF